MKPRKRLMWSLMMVPMLLFAGRALAAQAPATLTLVVDAVAAAKTPLYIAKEQNLFRKHGLEARVVSIGGASLAIQAGIGGDADVLDADEGSVILSALQAGPPDGGSARRSRYEAVSRRLPFITTGWLA